MFKSMSAFWEGMGYHGKGFRFALQHRSFFFLSLLPFCVAFLLYGAAFYFFSRYSDTLLNTIWSAPPQSSSSFFGWLHTAYVFFVRYFLYLVIMVVMVYTFIVFANILGSPVYDYIAVAYSRTYHGDKALTDVDFFSLKQVRMVWEELKKGFFMLLAPLLLLFIPLFGTLAVFFLAPIFAAWNYVDFSLAKDCIVFKQRMAVVWRHKFYLLGFGAPLVIPIFGIIFVPFAILGATRLYFERIRAGVPRTYLEEKKGANDE